MKNKLLLRVLKIDKLYCKLKLESVVYLMKLDIFIVNVRRKI